MNKVLKTLILATIVVPTSDLQAKACNNSHFYFGVSAKFSQNKFNANLNKNLKPLNSRLADYYLGLEALKQEFAKYNTNKAYVFTIAAEDESEEKWVKIRTTTGELNGQKVLNDNAMPGGDLNTKTRDVDMTTYHVGTFNLVADESCVIYTDPTNYKIYKSDDKNNPTNPPQAGAVIFPSYTVCNTPEMKNTSDKDKRPMCQRIVDKNLQRVLKGNVAADVDVVYNEDLSVGETNNPNDTYTKSQIHLEGIPKDTYVTNAKGAAIFTQRGIPDSKKMNGAFKKRLAIEISKEYLNQVGYKACSTLSFLTLSGSGVINNAFCAGADFKSFGWTTQALRLFEKSATAANDDVAAANDSAISLGEAFTNAIKGDSWSTGLKDFADSKKLTYSDLNSDLQYSETKNKTFGLSGFIGYDVAFGDLAVFGEGYAEMAVSNKESNVQASLGNGSSDQDTNNGNNNNDNNANNNNNGNDTAAPAAERDSTKDLTITKGWSLGLKLGVKYYITRKCYVAGGIDISRSNYKIKTNDLGSNFIADADSVYAYKLNELRELGLSDMTLKNWNKDAVATGIGKDEIRTSKWGWGLFGRIGYQVTENVSGEIEFNWKPKTNIMKTGDGSFADISEKGFGIGARVVLAV